MKSIVFDAGPVISLTSNGLLWLLEPLKEKFKGSFYTSNAIKKEMVDKPLRTKRFKFGAMKVQHYIDNDTIEISKDKEVIKKTDILLDLANNTFIARGNPIKIVHYGEMSGLAVAIINKSKAYVVDERTTRLLMENPNKLKNILGHTLHTNIKVDQKKLKELKRLTKDIRIIRSAELVTIAYELGLLDKYSTKIPYSEKILLESVLWGVKLNGCAVSKKELERIMKLESKR